MTRPAARLLMAPILILACAGPIVPARAQVDPARQVTLFGILATPGAGAVDPRLAKVAPQLRQLLPNYGFKLLDVQSRRLSVDQALACDLEPGFSAKAVLVRALNPGGKVELRVFLMQGESVLARTEVATPPNQPFFCDKLLPDGSRLVVGVGAR